MDLRSLALVIVVFTAMTASAQPAAVDKKAQAEAVIQKAVAALGGQRYLSVTSQLGRGKYSVIRDGGVVSFQSFIDVIVYPDKERTEFRGGGQRTVQTNVGNTGWVLDQSQELVKVQDERQVENFRRGLRASLDYLLRGHWRGDGELTYAGRRAATLGRRNDVVKVTYKDGFAVEYEFSVEDGTPQKASYVWINADNEEIKEEDRYAQFIEVGGIKSPFIIDRFSAGKQTSRINYESIEYNRSFPDTIFAKPARAKDVKDLKL